MLVLSLDIKKFSSQLLGSDRTCKDSIGQRRNNGKSKKLKEMRQDKLDILTIIRLHRGGGQMKVKEYKIGGSTIEIYDDYIVKTEEEKQEILERIGRLYSGIFAKQKQESA